MCRRMSEKVDLISSQAEPMDLIPAEGLKPGQPALWTGRWQQRNSDGEAGRIVRATKGQPLPATPARGMRYFFVEAEVR